MIRHFESNNNDKKSPTRPITAITVQKSSHHHAVTSVKGNTSTNYISLMEKLVNFVFEHAKHCEDADRELEALLTKPGVVNK